MVHDRTITTSEVPGRLLQVLACPICKNPLSYNEAGRCIVAAVKSHIRSTTEFQFCSSIKHWMSNDNRHGG